MDKVIKVNKRDKMKEAQGRNSRLKGVQNKLKILKLLKKQPLTWKELADKNIFSHPTLLKHLKTMREQDWIEKSFVDNRIVYKCTHLGDIEIVKDMETSLMHLIALSSMFPNLLDKMQPSSLDKLKELIETRKERAEALNLALKKIRGKK